MGGLVQQTFLRHAAHGAEMLSSYTERQLSYYHVFLNARNREDSEPEFLDLSENELTKGIIKPYRSGRRLFHEGRTFSIGAIREIAILKTSMNAQDSLAKLASDHRKELERILREEGRRVRGSSRGRKLIELFDAGQDVTSEYIKGPPGEGTRVSRLLGSLQNPWVITVIGGLIVALLATWLLGSDGSV